jgi:hypothetical protein
VHGSDALISFDGKGYQSWCKNMQGRGYTTHTWHANAIHCGESIYSRYIVTFCYLAGSPHQPPLVLPQDPNIRPCQNLIRTYGIYKSGYLPTSLMEPSSHPMYPNLVATLYNQPVYQWDGPFGGMTSKCWILVPDLGIRRIQLDELEKLKGLTDSGYTNMTDTVLLHSVEQHVWSTLCHAVSIFIYSPAPPSKHHHVTLPTPPSKDNTPLPTHEWKWKPPDLTMGKQFYNDRVRSL